MKIIEKFIFQPLHYGAAVLAKNLVFWFWTKLEKLHHLWIDLARGLKYFDDVELVYPPDPFQVCSIFNMFTENYNKPRLPAANTAQGFYFFCCEHIKDPTNLKRVRYFCFYPASKKTSFGFCSCSELLQLKFGKKKLQRNANCSAPKTVIGVTKVANERYLPYLQLCGIASMWIFMYCRCKSGPKLR